jgi:[ribosomal protein S5]-alanine N-acetyltransferase
VNDFALQRTARLQLRRVQAGDLDAVARIHSDPRTYRFTPGGPLTSPHDVEDLLGVWLDDWRRDGLGYWAVSVLDRPSMLIGFGGIRRFSWSGREVWNQYYRLSPDVWGKGYATEITQNSVAVWRKHGSGLPILARTKPDNIASQRTALAGGLERRSDLDVTAHGHTDIVFALGWERA